MIPQSTAACFEAHMGLWHIEPRWFGNAFGAVKSGVLKPQALNDESRERAWRQGFELLEDGTAIILIQGHMTKGGDSFGGGSTVRTRRQIRAAINMEDVQRVLLHIDSPGGTVAGTGELAADVVKANRVKPVFAFLDDLGASAAYFVASGCRRIFATAMAEVGSIGTLMVVHDLSKMAEMAGIEVHVISTGAFKGAGAAGTEVTAAHLAYFQEIVDGLNVHFLEAVSRGRGLSGARLEAVTDGRIFIAAEAQRLGLVDEIASFDDVVSSLSTVSSTRGSSMADQILLDASGKPMPPTDMAMLKAAIKEAMQPTPAVADAPTHEFMVEALRDAKAVGRQEGLVAGRAEGRLEGRSEAAEIAALLQVAELSIKTHALLAPQADGSYGSVEGVRGAINTMQVVASESQEISSKVLPGPTKQEGSAATNGHVLDVKKIYADRNAANQNLRKQ